MNLFQLATSTVARCLYLAACFAVICALIVLGPQPAAEPTPVASVPAMEPIRWHTDPHMHVSVKGDFRYEVDEITAAGRELLTVEASVPASHAPPSDAPLGVSVFAVLTKHDSTDLGNHVEDYVVEEMHFTDPRTELLHVVKTGSSTWTRTEAVASYRADAVKIAKDLAQDELALQGKLSTDISTFIYDSITVKVEGVVLARVDASYPLPMMAVPAGCLTGAAAQDADRIVVFGNDFGYIVVAASLEGFRGKIDSDIQLCWISGQENAIQALHAVADEFAGLAEGNTVVWHEGTKAMVLSADFLSTKPKANRNN